jgi:hypothetical protein
MTESREKSGPTPQSADDPLRQREASLPSRVRMPAGETGPEGQKLDFRLIHDFLNEKLPRRVVLKITGGEERPMFSEVIVQILDDSASRAALDDFLIERARLLGPHTLLSLLVRDRIFAWIYGIDQEADGRDLWKRFWAALDRFAGAERGVEQYPIDNSNLYGSRQDLVKEIKHLLPVLKKDFAGRRRGAVYAEVAERMLATVENSSSTFSRLYRNLGPLTAFLCGLRRCEEKEILRMAIRNFTITPASLVNEWLGWAANCNPEDLRQLISDLGRRKKS